MATKYLKEARACLSAVALGERARLDASVRRGMIGELRARGIEVYKERADAYVAQRYADANYERVDEWSDAAREAAAEARRANAAGKKAETPDEHHAAAQAHLGAAKAARGEAAAARAEISDRRAETLAAAPQSVLRQGTTVHDPRAPMLEKAAANAEKAAAKHEAKAGEHAAQAGYHVRQTEVGPHLFPTATGKDLPAKEGTAFNRNGEKVKIVTPAKESRGETVSGGVPGRPQTSGKNTQPVGVKSQIASAKASAASTAARAANTVSAHGEASSAHSKAAQAAMKAGKPAEAAAHKQAAAEHLAAMHNVHNANVQTANRERAETPIGKAENIARGKSAEANQKTRSMAGAGGADEHEKAASMHTFAKRSWHEVERLARASGNEFKASAAHTNAEQHSVKSSEHQHAASALRAARSRS